MKIQLIFSSAPENLDNFTHSTKTSRKKAFTRHILHFSKKDVSYCIVIFSSLLAFHRSQLLMFTNCSLVDSGEDIDFRIGITSKDDNDEPNFDSDTESEFEKEYRFCKGDFLLDTIETNRGEYVEAFLDEDGKTIVRSD